MSAAEGADGSSVPSSPPPRQGRGAAAAATESKAATAVSKGGDGGDAMSETEVDASELELLSQGANVEVVVRVRPLLDVEASHTDRLLDVDGTTGHVRLNTTLRGSTKTSQKDFKFNTVFSPTATQDDLFRGTNMTAKVLAVLRGYNATVFAYGQTGSGKTHTMEGYKYETLAKGKRGAIEHRLKPRANFDDADEQRVGLVPRTVHCLFNTIARLRGGGDAAASTTSGAAGVGSAGEIRRREYKVRCSFLQIYNEQVYDLFNASHLRAFGAGPGGVRQAGIPESSLGPGLRVRWSADKDFYVENLFKHECSNYDEMMAHFHAGLRRKIMASHRMNAASSRSHCVFSIHVEAVDPARPSEVVASRLSLVDLAGSERIKDTRARGQTLQESIGINRSLFVLRTVITSLAAPVGDPRRKHVPYRDSKLTALLKHSLGGNSITLMVACLSPSDEYFEENLSTLSYAATTACIENRPEVNEDPKTRLIKRLRAEIVLLKRQLKHAQDVAALALGDDDSGALLASGRSGASADSGHSGRGTLGGDRSSGGGGGGRSGTKRVPSRPASPITPSRASSSATNTAASPLTRRADSSRRSRPPARAVDPAREQALAKKATDAQRQATAARDAARKAQSRASAATQSAKKAKAEATKAKEEASARAQQIQRLEAMTNRKDESAASLKRDMLSHITMIKKMFRVEQQVRAQLDAEIEARGRAEEENTDLNLENQNLRERVEILEYLIKKNDDTKRGAGDGGGVPGSASSADGGGSADDTVIPGYGPVDESDVSDSGGGGSGAGAGKGKGRRGRRTQRGGGSGDSGDGQWAQPVRGSSQRRGASSDRARKPRAQSASRSRPEQERWDTGAVPRSSRRGKPGATGNGTGSHGEGGHGDPGHLSVDELRDLVRSGRGGGGGRSSASARDDGNPTAVIGSGGLMLFPNAYTPSAGFKAAAGVTPSQSRGSDGGVGRGPRRGRTREAGARGGGHGPGGNLFDGGDDAAGVPASPMPPPAPTQDTWRSAVVAAPARSFTPGASGSGGGAAGGGVAADYSVTRMSTTGRLLGPSVEGGAAPGTPTVHPALAQAAAAAGRFGLAPPQSPMNTPVYGSLPSSAGGSSGPGSAPTTARVDFSGVPAGAASGSSTPVALRPDSAASASSQMDPMTAMAELNDLMMARARLKRGGSAHGRAELAGLRTGLA